MISYEHIDTINVKKYMHHDPSSVEIKEGCLYLCYPHACCVLCLQEGENHPSVRRVNRRYFDLCYDEWHQRFYALEYNNHHRIYVLDVDFFEIDCIEVDVNEEVVLLDLACDSKSIYVLLTNQILKINSEEYRAQCLCDQDVASCVSFQVGECIQVKAIREENHSCIALIQKDNCEVTYLSIDGCILDMIFCCPYLYVLVNDECQHFVVMKFSIEDGGCHEAREMNCELLIKKTADIEKAIACILNAEGAKIQQAIKNGSSVQELMEVNDCVTSTLIQITHLEHLLYSKLLLCKGCLDKEICCFDDIEKVCGSIGISSL